MLDYAALSRPVTLPPVHQVHADRLGLRPAQYRVYANPKRNRVLCAGRRVGKTRLIVHELVRAAHAHVKGTVVYIAPTRDMAKDILWKQLKEAIPPQNIAEKNESELWLTLKGTGSTIRLYGAEAADRMRGLTLCFAAFDEYQDIDPAVFELVVQPALSSTRGQAIFCGTPKGRNHFYDLFMRAKNPDNAKDWAAFMYSTIQGGNVDPEEIETARRTISRQAFEQEYLASFLLPEGRIYSSFAHENIDPTLEDTGGDLLVGMDFNVDPMTAVCAIRAGDQLHVLHEIEIMNSHTAQMAEEIKRRFPKRRIVCFPDPAGRQRKTSAGGSTDFTILRDAGFQVVAPPKAPRVEDRTNTVQAALCSAAGYRRLLIHPRCVSLIKSFEGLAYQKGTRVPDKSSGLDHIIDACGYLVCHEMPMRRPALGVVSVVGG